MIDIPFSDEPVIDVGITDDKIQIQVQISGKYQLFTDKSGKIISDDSLEFTTESVPSIKDYILLKPLSDKCKAAVSGITIGKKFHWQQNTNQVFPDEILIKKSDNNKLILINRVHIEKYLSSVISSEMNSNSPLEFLKAHAIISRSWVIAQMMLKQNQENQSSTCSANETDGVMQIWRWTDQSLHRDYLVCADDHCQRYQGISRIENPAAIKAVQDTRGEILSWNNQIVDARFSKCCGGLTEKFSTCWQDRNYEYLMPVFDSNLKNDYDLSDSIKLREWIDKPAPSIYCNEENRTILSSILPDFDQKTTDFFRWETYLSQNELQEIIKEKTGLDIGRILEIFPIKISKSGRIYQMQITGENKTIIAGKELEIRKLLSRTHLYSSCFYVSPDYPDDNDSIPKGFLIKGAGWGHGVGLCQIGAGIMALNGKSYKDILAHYYQNTSIEKVY